MINQEAKNCLFCKIADKEISSYVIYEDRDVLAFLDTTPLTLGHTVVIPKRHVNTIIDLPDNLVGPVFTGVKISVKMLSLSIGAENFTIGINHGRMLGNPDIDHMHIHVIPRFHGDGGGDIHSIVRQPPDESLQDTHKRIIKVNISE